MINRFFYKLTSQFVGVAGFEPATSCSQSRRDNRATLHPVNAVANIRLLLLLTNKIINIFSIKIKTLKLKSNT